ncbi:MAG: PDZ domain-containing protein [Anaerolineae bacterium]|nr:PDZ domain-containing protein [Anaerolineae bacterium]
MRVSTKAGTFAALLVALLFAIGFAGSGGVVTAQDATATPTGEATQAPTLDATAQATQDSNAGQTGQTGQGQAQPLDWMNIPMCVQVAATAEATADLLGQATQDAANAGDQATVQATTDATADATAAATEQQGPGEPTATLDPATTPYLGILAGPVSNCGVQVLDVFVGSPAEDADVQVDDVIVAVDNTLLADHVTTLRTDQGQTGQGDQDQTGQADEFNSTVTEALFDLIRSRLPGDVVTLTVQRNSTNMQIVVTLGSLPPELSGQGTPAATLEVTATPSS